MNRTRVWSLTLAVGCLGAALGAAPAAPAGHPVRRTIDQIRAEWAQPNARPQPNAAGWNALFNQVNADLDAFARAGSEDDRLRALARLHRISTALGSVPWSRAAQLNGELRNWLRPRVALAWGIRQVRDAVRGLPAAASAAAQSNREHWLNFTGQTLGDALRAYDSATTVAQRQESLDRIHEALRALDAGNQAHPWSPALVLESALNDLFNRPNLDVTADVNALQPILMQPMLKNEQIFFKGQLSTVTAGPMTGFGLLPSDDGIAFYNKQVGTSVTPIRGFQEQVAQDRQGRRAAKLYQFNATQSDTQELTVTAVLKTTGLLLSPSYLHNISASVGSLPIEGKGVGRFVASLVGFNQNRITDQVYDGAVPQIRQQVVQGASELGEIRISEAAAQQNAKIRQFLVGNNTLRYQNFGITGLSLRSQPAFALIGGKVVWLGDDAQFGADADQPAPLQSYQPGVSADVHLPSVASNMARGYFQTPKAQQTNSFVVQTFDTTSQGAAKDRFTTSTNLPWPEFIKIVDEVRAANNPKRQALRLKRPDRAPEFSADVRGNLVVLVYDFVLDVPAPAAAARGGLLGPAAKVYRIASPRAEFSISFSVAPSETGTMALRGKVEEFDAGPTYQVYAINEDPDQPTALNAFTRVAIANTLGARLKGQPIDVPLVASRLPNLALTSVSELDPSGWMRVVLTPTR